MFMVETALLYCADFHLVLLIFFLIGHIFSEGGNIKPVLAIKG